jgi:hypothetical protein
MERDVRNDAEFKLAVLALIGWSLRHVGDRH